MTGHRPVDIRLEEETHRLVTTIGDSADGLAALYSQRRKHETLLGIVALKKADQQMPDEPIPPSSPFSTELQ